MAKFRRGTSWHKAEKQPLPRFLLCPVRRAPPRASASRTSPRRCLLTAAAWTPLWPLSAPSRSVSCQIRSICVLTNVGLYLWPPEPQLRTASFSLSRLVHSVLTFLDQGPSSYSTSSYNSQPTYTGTAAFGSYQATPAGSGYNGAPSYSYNSPPPQASTSTRPAKQTSPASSKPTAPRNPEQDLDAWLDEKPKAKKAASRKRAAEPKSAENLMSLEPKKPADPLAELLGSPAPAEEDAFAAFAAVPSSSPRPAGDVDPFEAFGATAATPTNDTAAAPAAEGEEADPFAAFLSSTARPASAPPAPAVVSTVEELVAPPSPESDSAAAPAPAPVRTVAKAATAKPKAPRAVKPAAPVSRTAVDKLKDTTSNKRNDEVRSRSLAIMNSAVTDRRVDSAGPAKTAR